MRTSKIGKTRAVWLTSIALCCLTTGAAQAQNSSPASKDEQQQSWQPKLVKLVRLFADKESRTGQGLGWTGVIKPILPHFVETIETKPLKHSEKLYYYYAWLLTYSGKKQEGNQWQQKCLQTPYNRIEALMGQPRAILREYPLYWDGQKAVSELLNILIVEHARNTDWEIRKVPTADRAMAFPWNERVEPWRHINGGKLETIANLFEQMGDYKAAIYVYQNADICIRIDTALRIDRSDPHSAWEKIAQIYEKLQDWDMALHWRLKQLAATTNDSKDQVKPLTDKVIYLLARIGAAEPVEPLPPPKYDLEKLRYISQLYCDMWFPDEGMKVVQRMEQVAGKELPEERARIIESKANIVFQNVGNIGGGRFWPLLWDQVWTYDKVVAVHKQAIEWGKKAGWEEARLKKLEDQITKLPDLLKYVKEPKNFQDLLEGKTTEPKW